MHSVHVIYYSIFMCNMSLRHKISFIEYFMTNLIYNYQIYYVKSKKISFSSN